MTNKFLITQNIKFLLIIFLLYDLFPSSKSKRFSSLLEDEDEYKLSPPKFSKESGFYDNEFQLTLSSSEGATIFYTIDGTNPEKSETAKEYKDPIQIKDRSQEPNVLSKYCEDMNSPLSVSRRCNYKGPQYLVDKAMVVRAVAKKSNDHSKIIDQTYFVTTGELEHYKDFPVVSLVTDPENLFDPEIGIYVTGNMYIDWLNGPNYNPGKNQYDTDNLCNYFMRGEEWRRPASITIIENGSIIVNENVGIGLKGASTRNNPGKSFNIFLKKKYGATVIDSRKLFPDNFNYESKHIDKYYTFSLRQICETYRYRDQFATDIIKSRENITVTDMRFSSLFINGEYWGTYAITEKFTTEFIESHFGIPKDNAVIINSNEMEDGPEEELEKYFSFMEEYSKKDYSQQKNYEDLCTKIDVYSLVEDYAIGLYLANSDWPNKNFGAWRNLGNKIEGNPYSDGKWRFMAFDFDASMGINWGSNGDFYAMDRRKKDPPTSLFVSLIKNEDFRNLFINVLCDYANEVAGMNRIKKIIEFYKTTNNELLVDSLVRWVGGNDPKMQIYSQWKQYLEKEMTSLSSFFSGRANTIITQMKSYLGLKGELQEINISLSGKGKIKINTIVPEFVENKWSGKYYSDSPVTITALSDEKSVFKGWKGDVESTEKTIVVSLTKSMKIEALFEN